MYGLKKYGFVIGLVFMAMLSNAQTISGKLSFLANQEIALEGFNGLQTYAIATTKIDANGNFKLAYASTDLGMGYLKSTDNKPLLVVLSGEEIELLGESLSNTQTIKITKGKQNQWFEQYAQQHPRREQALSAWDYLENIYTTDALFTVQAKPRKAILKEKQRIQKQDELFLQSLPKESYVSWFLPVRKLVSSVATIAQYRTKEIPATMAAFRALDYTDKRLYKSGLFKDAIESHFWLLENSGRSLDSVFIEMKLSIDTMFEKLVLDEAKLNEVTNHLFDLLEKHSLFQASEYLALKVLNELTCTIDSDLAKQPESYRAMKKGTIAPDISFGNSCYLNGIKQNIFGSLTNLITPYTLVVFGASWCPKCKEEMPAIAKLYSTWKAQGVEVLLVSLDEDQKAFYEFTINYPFISISDLKKWDGTIAKDYYVFGTPTMYLLDKNRKIILRPNSVKQMDAWVDWYLVKANAINQH